MGNLEFERQAKLGRGYASKLLYGDRGKRMDRDMMQRIATVLQVGLGWVVSGLDEETHQGSALVGLQLAKAVAIADGAPEVYVEGWTAPYPLESFPPVRVVVDDIMADARRWQREQEGLPRFNPPGRRVEENDAERQPANGQGLPKKAIKLAK